MKICIIANGDALNSKTWSGTPYNIAIRLQNQYNVEVVSLDLKKLIKHPIYNLYRKTVGKIFYIKGSPRDPLLYKKDSKIICNELKKIGADINLFCAEYCLCEKNDNTLYYSYVDATLRPLLEIEKNKMGIEKFLKKYEENEKQCYNLLDGVFTMNDWSKDSINKLYKKDKEQIYNIGFGINTEFYSGTKDYTNAHLLIILRKGTEHLKGLDLLLDAFKIAKKKVKNLKLSVVGTDYKNVDGVEYYYDYPRSKTIELLQEASIYIMPAIKEPNGITYLEALANKTPIIGLNRFAFPEFSGYGKYGFISKGDTPRDVADTIIFALSNPDKLKEIGEKGQNYVKQKYNWDTVVEKMMNKFRGGKK